MESSVLVVGAGPVGLTAALMLTRFGIPVRIIDQNTAATSLSKALVLWRRSLINLDSVIPLESWLPLGLVPKGLRICNQGAYKATLTLEHSGHLIPHGLLISQSEVEAKMVETLRRFDVVVERETALVAFEQDSEKVTCQLKGPRGDELIETPYLLGCDGAHSTVRHKLGLEFPGESITHRWLLGDIEIKVEDGVNPHAPKSDRERTVDPGWIYSSTSDQGSLLLFPITDTRYRLFAESGEVTSDTPRITPTMDDLQRAICERSRLQWKITETHWLSEFRINERQVKQYVHQRVFVAGDAAHVHSPAGGQGMNTGIQDATNLAWKVALTVNGCAAEDLIQTYQEERHPVAARVLKLTGRAIRMVMSKNRLQRGVQDLMMATLTNLPQFRKAATSILAEDDIAYLHSSLVGDAEGHAIPGTALPDVSIEIDGQPSSAIQLLRPTKSASMLTLILMPKADASCWPAASTIQVRQMGQDFQDPDQHLSRALGLDSDSGLLVRPDAIIATCGSPASIMDWLKRWIPQPQNQFPTRSSI